MSLPLGSLVALVLAAPAALASDLDVRVVAAGQGALTVAPGAAVAYQVIGELGDFQNEGLALFRFDLSFDGGPLPQAAAPTSDPLLRFASPLGLSNPAGFGGTPSGGRLVQVGGGQNTIRQTFAPKPKGAVVTGVAQPGFPEVLVAGSLSAPTRPGVYTLRLSDLHANVIRQGDTGVPFFRVDEAPAGSIDNLVITVAALSASPDSVSLSAGGAQTMRLDAGHANQSRIYLLLGSVSGTAPGIALAPSVVLPLNAPDPYLDLTLSGPNLPPLASSFSALDAQGRAVATFTLPAGSPPGLAGLTAVHAYVLLTPVLDFASNAVAVTLVP